MKDNLNNRPGLNQLEFCKVIKAAPPDFVPIDLSSGNTRFTKEIFLDGNSFCSYINSFLTEQQAKFAYGGYGERRNMYKRSTVFTGSGNNGKPRNLHLGVDVWGAAGTPFFMPFNGLLHSSGFHNELGNYGTVLIMEHEENGQQFYTLYGHCAKSGLEINKPQKKINKGSLIGHIGKYEENGHWPPHLHLQLILDLQGFNGDYPGVCAQNEKLFYLNNCPDATFLIV